MDGRHRGLTVRGNSVQMSFTIDGQRCRERIRLGAPPTKTQLRQLANKRSAIIYEHSVGTFNYKNHFPSSKTKASLARNRHSSQLKISEALNQWIVREKKRLQPSTVKDYGSSIRTHLIPSFGEHSLENLSTTEIKQWISSLDISNKRINNVLVPLRQIYQEAFDEGIIQINPLVRVKNLKLNTREPKPFTLDEIDRILSQLEGAEKNLIQFGFWSGLRTSELIALRWQDVDFPNRRTHVRVAKVQETLKAPKTSTGIRIIELNDVAYEALANQWEKTQNLPVVFQDPKTGVGWKSDQPIRKRVWIPALNRAGIDYRNPYQTRHTFASHMLMMGKNPSWVAKQLGHVNSSMVHNVYSRWIQNEYQY